MPNECILLTLTCRSCPWRSYCTFAGINHFSTSACLSNQLFTETQTEPCNPELTSFCVLTGILAPINYFQAGSQWADMSLICPMRSSCIEIIAATQYSPCAMTLSPYWQLLYSVSPCGSIQPCQVKKWMPLVLRERAHIYCMSKSFYPWWCVVIRDKGGGKWAL